MHTSCANYSIQLEPEVSHTPRPETPALVHWRGWHVVKVEAPQELEAWV